jgi:hypothetical protein
MTDFGREAKWQLLFSHWTYCLIGLAEMNLPLLQMLASASGLFCKIVNWKITCSQKGLCFLIPCACDMSSSLVTNNLFCLQLMTKALHKQ